MKQEQKERGDHEGSDADDDEAVSEFGELLKLNEIGRQQSQKVVNIRESLFEKVDGLAGLLRHLTGCEARKLRHLLICFISISAFLVS